MKIVFALVLFATLFTPLLGDDIVFVYGDEGVLDIVNIIYPALEEVPIDPEGGHPLGNTYSIKLNN
jgi:hypothetical protein